MFKNYQFKSKMAEIFKNWKFSEIFIRHFIDWTGTKFESRDCSCQKGGKQIDACIFDQTNM